MTANRHEPENRVVSDIVDLNDRQQRCLQVIYEQDQENERLEKGQWTRGGRPRPAIEWRWMYYGIEPLTGTDSPLRHRLKAANLVDPGTGATFEALEKRRYILIRYKPAIAGDPHIFVQITPRGRKVVRTTTGEKRENPLPPGTLRAWHWRALALAFKSRPEGVMAQGGWYGDYGSISWNTWLRLRDYRDGALIVEYRTKGPHNAATGTTYDCHWLRLSELGEQFYRQHWQQYRELYPDIDAPAPTGKFT